MLSHTINRFICSQRDLWIDLGRLESQCLRKTLDVTPITAPVYITGMARGGTTITLELLSQAESVVTHTYRDFPLLFTPYLLRRFFHFFDRFSKKTPIKTERSHKDRILITPASPESMEEVLWMSFFRKLHEPNRNNVLDENTSRPRFERFYADHIKKLMIAEDAHRYVSKANYNATRIRYLRKLFPDARFLLLVRDPLWHIASIMKQDKLFREVQEKDPAAVEHVTLTGHFEFGLGRRLINTGDEQAMAAIEADFTKGWEVEGWARYWNSIYSYLLTLLEDPALRQNLMVVHYEELCADTPGMLQKIFAFTGLSCSEETRRKMAEGITKPEYYKPAFSAEEAQTIHTITGDTYRAYDRFRTAEKAG